MNEHETAAAWSEGTARAVWATQQNVERFRRAFADQDPTALGIVARARMLTAEADSSAAKPADIGSALVLWWAEQDDGPLRQAIERAIALATTPESADLVIARWTMEAALLLDGGGDAADESVRQRLVAAILTLIDRQLDVPTHKGDPHAIGNNHWAVTQSSILAAAMVCHGRSVSPDTPPIDMTTRICWARERVSAYVAMLGDEGLGHEGIGYLMYAMSYVLPVTVGGIAFDGVDLGERWPKLRRLAASLFMTGIAKPPREASADDLSASKLAWNDDGPGWPELCTLILSVHLAPAEQTPALRWMFDQFNGVHGSRRFGDRDSALAFTALYYPFDIPAAEPETPDQTLPLHRFDAQQGMSLFRNRYRDGDDAVVGLYTKATFAGGHRQDDAGSVRLSALGHDWIVGGGQARPDRRYQSVVCPTDGSRGKLETGAVLWDQAFEGGRGGVAGCDLRKVSGAYHERWLGVAFDPVPSADVATALLDLVDDHLGREWAWHMTFAPELEYGPDEDRGGFVLRGESDTCMHVRFCGVAPDHLELEQTPASQRTFQSAPEPVIYPARPYVTARFEPRDHLAIYAVMVIRRGAAAAVELHEQVDVAIDGQLWSKPFGCAIDPSFDLDTAGGTCRFPKGRSWHLQQPH